MFLVTYRVTGPPETLCIQLMELFLALIALWFLYVSGRTCWTWLINRILGWKSARPKPDSLFIGPEWQPILNALFLLVILVLSFSVALSENPWYLTLFRLTALKRLPWTSWLGAAKIILWWLTITPNILNYCPCKTKRQKLLLNIQRASAPVIVYQWRSYEATCRFEARNFWTSPELGA